MNVLIRNEFSSRIVFTIGYNGAYEVFLLNVIDEGNAIIAEIIRLRDFLPKDIRIPSKSRYAPLLLDFGYFMNTEFQEKTLEKLEELQEAFYGEHGTVLRRFELLFETLSTFTSNFLELCDQVAQELGNAAAEDSTKELEVECLSTMASVLFHLERCYDGPVRERIYVAVYRNTDSRTNVEVIVELLRRTLPGVESTNALFKRIKPNEKFVTSCLSFFDAGKNTRTKLMSTHRIGERSTETLFLCLLFSPAVLSSDATRMRGFVENYFHDKWVLAIGLCLMVNVWDEWTNYPSAFTALAVHLTLSKAKQCAQDHYQILLDQNLELATIRTPAFSQNVHTVAQYNSSLKWLVLHTYVDLGYGKKARTYLQSLDVANKFETAALGVVLKLAHFENELRRRLLRCVNEKRASCEALVDSLSSTLNDIGELFSKGINSLNMEKKTKLHDWFTLIGKTLKELDVESSSSTDLVVQIRRKIAQVGEMLDLGANVAMAHHLAIVQGRLDELAALVSLGPELVHKLAAAAHSDYLWPVLDNWIPSVQKRLVESSNTQPVRALFQKLSLAIDNLDTFITEENQRKLIGRAYSYLLERRLQTVLQSVPHHLFSLLHSHILPHLHVEWETYIEKTMVRELADFEQNFLLSEATYTIANMSIGISRMALRKVGTVPVNPKELLEEGIRQELSLELPKLFQVTDKEIKEANLHKSIEERICTLHTFHEGFLYMCEHMDVNGHELWNEQLLTMCENFAQKAIDRSSLPKELLISEYVVDFIRGFAPVTRFLLFNLTYGKKSSPENAVEFIYSMLMAATNTSTHRFHVEEMTWKEIRSGKESISANLFNMIEKWVPSYLVSALDTILQKDLQKLLKDLDIMKQIREMDNGPAITDCAQQAVFDSKHWETFNKSVSSAQSMAAPVVAKVGQIVLLREQLSLAKRQSGKVRAFSMLSAVENTNRKLLQCLSSVPPETCELVPLLIEGGLMSPRLSLASISLPSSDPVCFLLLLLAHTYTKLNGSKKDALCRFTFSIGLIVVANQLNCLSQLDRSGRALMDHLSKSTNKSPIGAEDVRKGLQTIFIESPGNT